MSRVWILSSGSARVGTLPAGVTVKRVRRVVQQLANALGRRVSARLASAAATITRRRKPKTNSTRSTTKRPKQQRRRGGMRRSGQRKRARRRTRRNPAGAAQLAQARRTFERWHGFEPRDVTPVKFNREVPRVLVRIGEVAAVEYISNKWTGRKERYRHAMKTPRPLLCTGPDAKGLYVVGGRVKVTERGLVD